MRRGEHSTCTLRKGVLIATIGIAMAISCAAFSGCQSNSGSQGGESSGSNEVTLTEWTEDTDCTACHSNETNSTSDSNCTVSKHSSLTCTTCHDDKTALASLHEGVSSSDRQPTRLKKTEVSSSVCLGCHDATELAQQTDACTALTDSNGTVVNPHSLPDTSTHSSITCTNCHSMHSEQTDLDGDAKSYCLSCHHANVFQCYTCHQHS